GKWPLENRCNQRRKCKRPGLNLPRSMSKQILADTMRLLDTSGVSGSSSERADDVGRLRRRPLAARSGPNQHEGKARGSAPRLATRYDPVNLRSYKRELKQEPDKNCSLMTSTQFHGHVRSDFLVVQIAIPLQQADVRTVRIDGTMLFQITHRKAQERSS